ncbi:hypothetical protein HMPREF1531_01564 [Propionibacterium sp. oral taxon 192 str. F0372]|uniref:hypothetical protein n=1 Tax=Propionibacterium sp. oral taxon 192 TaxID=671222 RepID=UPI000353DB0C|nr:hypothetical protein [Propionibacterium sp. oral taxon 192]EPH03501.1 hypothetical protein HMPREF1531_01564 [Propionibacterium sp. oral taxon 192 str. F0372]
MTSTSITPVDSSTPTAAHTGIWTIYRVMLRWNLLSLGPMLPLVIVVQSLMAAGIIIGFGLIIPHIDSQPAIALFMVTGTPTVLLMTVGFVMVPQTVAQARTNGHAHSSCATSDTSGHRSDHVDGRCVARGGGRRWGRFAAL